MSNPVPDSMHTLTPHLVCAGASAAIDFYKQALGAVELMRLPGPDGKLMHAALRIGDSMLMLMDPMGPSQAAPRHADDQPWVIVHLEVADADAVFASAVAAGARPVMPVAEQFWGDRYGQFDDPFGHRWSVATHVRDVTPEEMQAAGARLFAG